MHNQSGKGKIRGKINKPSRLQRFEHQNNVRVLEHDKPREVTQIMKATPHASGQQEPCETRRRRVTHEEHHQGMKVCVCWKEPRSISGQEPFQSESAISQSSQA